MSWVAWILLGVVALAGESLSMALYLLYVGAAAFAAAVLALIGVPASVQVVVFTAVCILLLVLVRPRMLHLIVGRVPHRTLTNQGRLIERTAVVTQTVSAESGMIRVGNAEFWTARAQPPTPLIAVGTPVRIVFVDGLTAYVDPLPTSAAPAPAPAGAGPAELAREEN